MTETILTLTEIEAAYAVCALRIALDRLGNDLRERDREIMHALMIRLAAPLGLSDDSKRRIEGDER